MTDPTTDVQTIDAATGLMQVTDANGRKIQFARLTEAQRFDLFEVFGAQQPNGYAMGMAATACTLRNIERNGAMVPVPFPVEKKHIRRNLEWLGEAGMDALRAALFPPEPPKEDDDGLGTAAPAEPLALAKN